MSESTPELPRNVRLIISMSLLVSGLLAFSVIFVLVLAHYADSYHLDQAAETWIAHSRSADHGVLYPTSNEAIGHHDQGTVLMPIGILLNAVLSRMTGDYLVAAKLLSAASMLLLVYLMWAVMVRLRCSTIIYFGVFGATLLTQPMIHSATSIPVSALSMSLQLLAVMPFLDHRKESQKIGRHTIFLSALACTIAFFCNPGAIWGMLAIGVWLAATRARRLKVFIGYQAGLLLVAGAFFHLLSDGRFFDQLTAFSLVETFGESALWRSPFELFGALRDQAPATWVLIPLAVLGLVLGTVRGQWNIMHVSLICALVSALMRSSVENPGSSYLLDLIVLSGIGVAVLWRTVSNGRHSMGYAQAVMAMLLLWASLGGLIMNVHEDAVEALNTVVFGDRNPNYDPRTLSELVEGAPILETVSSDIRQ